MKAIDREKLVCEIADAQNLCGLGPTNDILDQFRMRLVRGDFDLPADMELVPSSHHRALLKGTGKEQDALKVLKAWAEGEGMGLNWQDVIELIDRALTPKGESHDNQR